MVQPVHSRISVFAFIGIGVGCALDFESLLCSFLYCAFLFSRQRNIQQDRRSSRIHSGNDLHLVPVDVIHDDVPHQLYVFSVSISFVPLPVSEKSFTIERNIYGSCPWDGSSDTSLHLIPGILPLSGVLHRESIGKTKILNKERRLIHLNYDSRSLRADGS